MTWEWKIDQSARKQMLKIPRKDAIRIVEAIEAFDSGPFSGDIEKIKGEDTVWRRRIGNYRIFYEVYAEQKITHIFKVARRGSHTY
jgi:mRNA interferase RelE/StbE